MGRRVSMDYKLTPIKLACKEESVDFDWDGTFADLTRGFTEEFTEVECPKTLTLLDSNTECRRAASRVFRLCLRDGPFYEGGSLAFEGFDLEEVREGDTITVNFEMYNRLLDTLEDVKKRLIQEKLKKAEKAERAKAAAERRNLAGPLTRMQSIRDLGQKSMKHLSMKVGSFDLRNMYDKKAGNLDLSPDEYAKLGFKEKVWYTLEEPTSSIKAALIATFMSTLILFSTVTFCVATLHGVYREDQPKDSFWFVSEAFCVSVFTVELAVRLWACPERRRFFENYLNVIDGVAILPFWIETIMLAATGSSTEVPGLSVLRVIRMVRVLRLLKMSKGSVMLFAETMQKSFKPLNMLFMILAVVIIVASALMYFIERGRYNFKMQYWERPVAYRCAVYLTSTAAMGASPTYQAGEGNDCSLISVAADQLSAGFLCTYPYRKNPNCVTVYEQSPFNSILHSFWWSWVSMCTVGYGDVNPATILGKTFAMIVVVVGVLVIALPVTVIGSNFSAGFNKEEEDREMAEKKLLVDERRRLADEALLMRESLSGSETSSPNFSRLQSLNDDGDSTAVPNRA